MDTETVKSICGELSDLGFEIQIQDEVLIVLGGVISLGFLEKMPHDYGVQKILSMLFAS